jgi:hypothetical protein
MSESLMTQSLKWMGAPSGVYKTTRGNGAVGQNTVLGEGVLLIFAPFPRGPLARTGRRKTQHRESASSERTHSGRLSRAASDPGYRKKRWF